MQISKIDTWIREAGGLSELSRKQIEALQLRKLNLILEREKNRNGFYRYLPRQISDLKELRMLPFTDSTDLVKSGPQMVLVSQTEISKVATELTSGTTGRAKRLFYTAGDREQTRCFFTAGIAEMVVPGEKVLVCMPSDGREGLLQLICDAVKRLGAIPIAFGVGRSYQEFLDINLREAPECYIGMPVPLLSVFRYAHFLGINMSFKKALLSADACAPAVFSALEQSLSMKPFLHYGLRESGLGGAVNCRAFDGMHVRENDIIAEIVDEQGEPVPDGEFGELVITTIGMVAMPLIRYKTGDRTRILAGQCRCKSWLKRLDHVTRIGQKSRIVKLDEILFAFPEVIDYRASESQRGLKIEIAAGSRPSSVCFLAALRKQGFSSHIKIETRVPDIKGAPFYIGKRSIL